MKPYDNLPQSVRDALDYLKTGGLGEVAGLTSAALHSGHRKIASDTDMAMALCILAQAGPDCAAALDQAQKVVDAVTFDDSGSLIAGVWKGGNGGLLSRETLVEVDLLRRMLIGLKARKRPADG